MLNEIQRSIVAERNNFGDHSVCGNDLALAAAAAILAYEARPDLRDALRGQAEHWREVIMESCPAIAAALRGEVK